ncbi:FtsX-like permease family protein [Paludibacteraceae bacterium OttesenSCG-928-F17]|nr:FtsX-like permease family protein [Paludibacteraceae bacterium OttesenSCG-928-F17]
MNFEYFIAKRIHFRTDKKRNVSRPAVRIATIGIALGLAVMLISIAVITGFKKEVTNKVTGFGGHIQVTNFDNNNTYEMKPIQMDESLVGNIKAIPGVRHVEHFITKPGILKTENDFQGIILKGIGEDFDWNFFQRNLVEGEILNISPDSLSNNILISTYLANLLGLHLGDNIYTYFIQDNVRARKFTITGLYSTDFIEYDKMFLITDIEHVRRLNGWDEEEFSGLEILINDFNKLDEVGELVYMQTANRFNEDGETYYTRTIKQMNPQIFSWLDLLDMNVWVILILMLAVSGFIMISGLLILILERTNMIGILKALGETNWSVRKIFIYHALFLIGKGMLWGNVIGLAICAVQYFFHIIPLDPAAYYVSYVPVYFNWLYIVLLNVGTFIASILMMIGPSYLITKISPAKIIRYE